MSIAVIRRADGTYVCPYVESAALRLGEAVRWCVWLESSSNWKDNHWMEVFYTSAWRGTLSGAMAFRPLKSFFSTAEELLKEDLPTLGGALLAHLKSYEGLNTVYQHAGLNRGYFRAMLDNRNVGLGPLPKEPEYGSRQPEVTKRMMEAWNWLERQGLLIHNDQQGADWFTISSEGEEYLNQEKRRVPPSPNPARVSKSTTGVPRALLSYSWDDSEHQLWVTKFAERLQGESGVKILFDQWHLNPGDDKLHFMEQAVTDSDFVIVVCTPSYAKRANKRRGGVGYESMVITAELAEHMLTNKFIPVLRNGTWSSSLPIYLKSRMGVDLSGEPYRADQYEKLLRALHGEPMQPPPIGNKPDFSKNPVSIIKPKWQANPEGNSPAGISAKGLSASVGASEDKTAAPVSAKNVRDFQPGRVDRHTKKDEAQAQYVYQASAVGLKGELIRPNTRTLPTQAEAVLMPEGGRNYQHVKEFELEGIVSFRDASSEVSGSYDENHQLYWSSVSAIVEGLNVRGMITADRVVSRLAVYVSDKNGEPSFDITGSYIENLRIMGHEIEVRLATHVFRELDTFSRVANAYEKRTCDSWLQGSGLVGMSSQQLQHLEDWYRAAGMSKMVEELKKRGHRPTERTMYRLSAASHLDLNSQIGQTDLQGYGSIICVPSFGIIRLAEVAVERSKRQINMLRVDLAGSQEATFMIGCAEAAAPVHGKD